MDLASRIRTDVQAEWIPFGQAEGEPIFLRRRVVYKPMEWQGMNLSTVLVAAAPNGGPIATTRNPRKAVVATGEKRDSIRFYTASGAETNRVDLGRTNEVVLSIGWTANEQLVCLTSSADVWLFNAIGTRLKTSIRFNIDTDIDQPLRTIVYGAGALMVSERGQLYDIANLHHEPRSILLAEVQGSGFPKAVEVIPPDEGVPVLQVLVSARAPHDGVDGAPPPAAPAGKARSIASSTAEAMDVEQVPLSAVAGKMEAGLESEDTEWTVYTVDKDSVLDLNLRQRHPFVHMSLSPDGTLIACFTRDGRLCVFTIDFSRSLSEFNTKSEIPPQQMVWCGRDAVVMAWDPESVERPMSLVLVVGPFGDYESFSFDGPVVLVQEIDCVRIISSSTTEVISKVARPSMSVFAAGSVDPAGLLYEAFEQFEARESNCFKAIRAIKDGLPSAVEAVIAAAGEEWLPDRQQMLLRAASFGKSFLEFFSGDGFVNMCRNLRVLNALRSREIGMPISMAQFDRVTPDGAIDRLLERDQHLLALRISDYLKLKTDKVLVHWARRKVASEGKDDEILRQITDRLKEFVSIPYHLIAQSAWEKGREGLAIALLEKEPNPSEQVPLLLDMGQFALAVRKAEESGDMDLLYSCITRIIQDKDLKTLFDIVSGSRGVAWMIFVKYCKEHYPSDLHRFLGDAGMAEESALMKIYTAYVTKTSGDPKLAVTEFSTALRTVLIDFDMAKKEFAQYSQLTKDEVELLRIQLGIVGSHPSRQDVLFAPAVGTLIAAAAIRGNDPATYFEEIRSVLKVSDKKFWWTRARAYVHEGDFEGLERLARERKVPIGFEPFAELCIDAKRPLEAEKYIARIADHNRRAEFYMEIGRFEPAAQAAFQAKNRELLQRAYDASEKERETQAKIELLIAKLREGVK